MTSLDNPTRPPTAREAIEYWRGQRLPHEAALRLRHTLTKEQELEHERAIDEIDRWIESESEGWLEHPDDYIDGPCLCSDCQSCE